MKKTTLILSLGIFLNGCATVGTSNPARLECPPPLVLPQTTTEQDLALYDADREAYTILVQRDRLQTARRKMLCNIIKSTQDN